MKTTIGQLLINEALPEGLRDYDRKITKKTSKQLLNALAKHYPERYNEVAHALMRVGADAATIAGKPASISLDSMTIGAKAGQLRRNLRAKIDKILDAPGLNQKQRDELIIKAVGRDAEGIRDVNLKEQTAAGNSLAIQVNSGARGNPAQFSSLNVGDMLVQDHRDKPIAVPLLNSYAEGTDPVEYWAGSYGARKGTVDTKFATPKGGFLAKQLALAAHRILVTEEDCGTANGIPVEGNDADNVGGVLARSYGRHRAGSVVTPKIGKTLPNKPVLMRSPLTCQAKGGVCSKCVGIRERGKFPDIGDNVGVAAAQAISEPVSQSALSSKHSGGIVGAGPTAAGFDAINQLVQVPKTFRDGATVASESGRVERIESAPQGGTFVTVSGTRHFISAGLKPLVAKGDAVEAGDVISQGLPNPSEIVHHKGIGAGRWHFMKIFRDTLKASKITSNRRNIELLTRGLINHAKILDADGMPDVLPDDVVEFDTITRGYTPRAGTRAMAPKRSVGRFLEKPVMQYSIGTRVTPRIAAEMKTFGVPSVQVNDDEPNFQPEMVRAMDTLMYSPDWMVRLGGFNLKKSLLESVHRGRASKEHQRSFIPALARGVEFGKAPTKAEY
jgi:DNA-directed RNA polymerase subunit beta'